MKINNKLEAENNYIIKMERFRKSYHLYKNQKNKKNYQCTLKALYDLVEALNVYKNYDPAFKDIYKTFKQDYQNLQKQKW